MSDCGERHPDVPTSGEPPGDESHGGADGVLSSDEVVEGEIDVSIVGERVVRVLIPAGVGIPGFDDAEVARAVVAELLGRTGGVPDVVDVSGLLASEPALIGAVQARLLAAG